jgi:hypothetical protein
VVEKADAEARTAYNVETNQLQQGYYTLRSLVDGVVDKCARIDMLRAEASKLQADACPTCERTWDQAKKRYQQTVEAINALAGEVANAEAHQELLIRADITLKARKYEPDPRIERLKAVHGKLREEAAAEAERVRAAGDRKKADVASRVAEVRRQIDALRARRDRPEQSDLVVAADRQIQQLTREYGAAQLACSEARSALALARQRN